MSKNFSCYNCGKSFKSNYHLKRHMSNKRPCISITKNNNIQKINKNIQNISKNIQNISKNIQQRNITQNASITTPPKSPPIQNDTSNTQLAITNSKTSKITVYNCEYCDRIFKYKGNLSRHINTLRCKKINKKVRNNILLNRKNKKILEINQKIKNSKSLGIINSNNSIINNTINNTNNNLIINFNPFGFENLDSISKEDKIKTLNQLYLAFPKALETIHFNVIENRNFFLANKRDKQYITYYNGTNLIYENSYKFKDSLCNKLMDHLEGWFNEYKNHLLKSKKTMLTKVFDEFYDGKLDDKYNKEIDKYLMTYSDDIKSILNETIKKVKSEKQIENLQRLQEQIQDITIS